MTFTLYAGQDSSGKYLYFDPIKNKYSSSNEVPSKSVLDSTNSSITLIGQNSDQMFEYQVNGANTIMVTESLLPSTLTPDQVQQNGVSLATPNELVSELRQALGFQDTSLSKTKILTSISSELFSGITPGTSFPTAIETNSLLPNQAQLSNELDSIISGTTNRNALNSMGKDNIIITPTKTTNDFRASLKSLANSEDVVLFKVTPVIDESRQANYDRMSPVHHPGTLQIYKNTESRPFTVSTKLISRTSEEATINLRYINLIRSWVVPYYGQGTAQSTKDKLGAPPDILVFSAYGEKNIKEIPVVLASYHWVYPDSIDYIPTNDGEPFPIIMEISLSLLESYSPEEYTSFDITKYKNGDMTGAYTFNKTPTSSI